MIMDRHQLCVFVFIASFLVTQQNLDESADSMFFHYNGQTIVECPSNDFQIEFASNCTRKCPEFAPFLFENLCLTFCPNGYEATTFGFCSKTVQTTASPERQNAGVNLLCQKGFCPSVRPFCVNYQCHTTCPLGTVIEDFSCVYTCSKLSPYMFNNTCVEDCPKEYPFIEANKCVANCSIGYVLSESECTKTCPQGKYRTSRTCIDSCLPKNKYEITVWNTSLCLDRCPMFTNINESKCQIQCPRELSFLWNMSCVQKCPDYVPFVYVLSRRLPPYKTPVCLPYCPDQTYTDGTVCVHRCITEMKIFNRTCVKECPEKHKYTYQQICVSACPTNSFIFNDTSCLRSCPINARYMFNMTCMESCPSGYKVLKDECVDACPSKHYLFRGECFPRCNYPYVSFHGSCLLRCPEEAKYLFDEQCRNTCPETHPLTARKYRFSVLNYCVNSCEERGKSPGTILYNMTCRSTCPSNLFTYNNTCVEKCPDVSRFNFQRRCFASCPNDYYSFDGSCVFICPRQAAYIYNETCHHECPLTHALHFVDTSTQRNGQNPVYCVDTCKNTGEQSGKLEFNMTCVDTCPLLTSYFNETCVDECPMTHRFNYTVKAGSSTGFRCVSSCKEYQQFSLDDQCVDHCPILSHNFTCVTHCPVSYMFIYNEEVDGTWLQHCVSRCPDNTYMLDNKCYIECPEPLASFYGNRSCLHRCPSSHKFRFLYNAYPKRKNLFRCEESCFKPRFVFEDQCIPECPKSNPYSIGQTCVHICDGIHKFLDPQTRKCLLNCTQPNVISNNTCVQTCPSESRFLVNNECTKACPKDVNLSSPLPKANICGSTCIDRYVQENATCVPSCSNHNAIVNNICINSFSCPPEYSFFEQSLKGKICRKACLDSQFIKNFECVTTCDSYFVNKECVEKCPATHQFTETKLFNNKDTECHTKCPASRFTDGMKCVFGCSGMLYTEDNTCVHHCPASHPFRSEIYSGICVKKCTALSMVYNNTSCMLKSKCYESNDLLVYDNQCVNQCPENTVLDTTKKHCISPTAVSLIVAPILMAVSVLVFVCVCFIIKSNSSGLKTNNIIDTDKLQPLDCASDINEEVSHSDTSSEQIRSETGNDGEVSIQVSMEGCDIPLVQYYRQMEPTTSTSDQFGDIYAGEMHINENTEAKTCYDETHC